MNSYHVAKISISKAESEIDKNELFYDYLVRQFSQFLKYLEL